ncbi:hypothetical protein SLEP1_g28037 [Rubroshorea leprosula]|uniref:Uncharacterized protein n=2 Tax=Rubroshorea leprosula TaxID=152421 RepID=A0AAV5K378_9ROSI|nr:hypothetical protein SLEP1_g28037 [Rubroshorea leprosula]
MASRHSFPVPVLEKRLSLEMEKLMLNLTFFRGSGQTASQAHGTFVCGKNGGGVAEEINCERDVNICIGTLTKAAVCHVGFIACSLC